MGLVTLNSLVKCSSKREVVASSVTLGCWIYDQEIVGMTHVRTAIKCYCSDG